jgi:hypothetical protein
MYLNQIRYKSAFKAEVETSLSFRYELEPWATITIVRNKARGDRSTAHLTLLETSPSIRVTKHEMTCAFQRIPQVRATRICVPNEVSSTLVKVSEKVAKDVYDRLAWW